MDKVIIIAEAGVNHNGDIDIAKKLVDVAVEAGADIVKFQTFKAEKLVCLDAEKAAYQKKNTSEEESQFSMLKKLELDEEEHYTLMKYCQKKGIVFLSTPFDIDSVNFLVQLGMKTIKIPSGEITNYPYLRAVGKTEKKVILSTGMSTLDEVKNAVTILKQYGSKEIIVLHCNTEYPTPYEDVNLKAMVTLQKELNLDVGYSDHTIGIEASIAAVALGAKVIEKHFTLDRSMEGPDHRASLTPLELKKLVSTIRNIEVALGDGIKIPSDSEKKNIVIARKSIVADQKIKKGQVFTEKNITTKRPGTGVSPMKWDEVLGKVALKDYNKDDMIEL